MTVTMLGTGTSAGVPVLTCNCAVCSSTDPNDNRLRTSALLSDGERSVLFDCGTDFRQQALRAGIQRVDGVLLTHAHADHISGIDDLRMYNFRQGNAIPIHGNAEALDGVRRRFDYCFTEPLQRGGGLPSLELVEVTNPFKWLGLRIIPVPIMHGKLGILGFRVGNFAYLTDASFISNESYALLEGVEYLVLNALRPKVHPTHFNIEQAIEAADRIGAIEAWFVHMTHDLMHAPTNQSLPKNRQLAHDGLQFTIRANAPLPVSVR